MHGSEGTPAQLCAGATRLFFAYAAPLGRTLIDRRLYLPASWTDDQQRCRDAGIGDEVGFATKVAIAKEMVRRAIADNIPFKWVTADASYGYTKGWRFELEQADVFHVMATARHDTVVNRHAVDHPVHDLLPVLPRQKWQRRSCGTGAHSPSVYDWARVEVRPWHRPDRRHWVIARLSIRRPEEISYYIAYYPAGTTLDALIRIGAQRGRGRHEWHQWRSGGRAGQLLHGGVETRARGPRDR